MHSLRNTALGNCLDLNRILIGKRTEEMALGMYVWEIWQEIGNL